MQPFTHTTWHIKPGMEEEFMRRWDDWVDWSHREGFHARATLLRDVESPTTFVSFGPWESLAAVKSWRGLPGYHERVARLREVVESFEPRTVEQVSER